MYTKTENTIQIMPLIIAYHGPSTTSRVEQSVLGRLCVSLRAIYRRYNILPSHKSRDNLVKWSLRTPH